MRVAFVNLEFGGGLTGVSRAVKGQAAAARQAGLPLDFWIVNSEREGTEGPIRYARFEPGPLGERARRLFKARVLAEQRQLDAYDVVLLRYPMAIDLAPLAFVRRCRAKVVTVHHSKEVEELLGFGRSAGILLRAGLERANGPRLLHRVAGIAAVTDEIRRYEVARARSDVPSRVIANGVDVAGVEKTGFRPFTGDELRMLFVASSHAPWHGTDRLLRSLRSYAGPIRLHLNMVGGASGAPAGTVERAGALTIAHHGMLHGDALASVFRDSTVAFSSLALFRTGLQEGCVLKTREYMARGMPFLYGYRDVDLTDDLPFCRRVEGSEDPLDVAEVIAFAESVTRTPALSDEMRDFALSHLDWKIKMRAFVDLARDVAEGSRAAP